MSRPKLPDEDPQWKRLVALYESGNKSAAQELFQELKQSGRTPDLTTIVSGSTIHEMVQILKADSVHFHGAQTATASGFTTIVDARVDPTIQLHNTLVCRELAKRAESRPSALIYRHRLESAVKAFARIIPQLEHGYARYAQFTYFHATLTADAVGRLLKPEQLFSLSDLELFLILAASLVSDIAVVVSPTEVATLTHDLDFNSDRTAALQSHELTLSSQDISRGVNRFLASDYVRRRYGRRCAMAIDDSCDVYQSLVSQDTHLDKCLRRIVLAQTFPYPAPTELSDLSTNERVGIESANAYFVAAALRLGALLDIKTPRISHEIADLPDPLLALSPLYWRQFDDITVSGVSPRETIEFSGTSPTQQAERLVRDWVRCLQEECELAVLALNVGKEQYTLHLGRIFAHLTPALGSDGLALYEFHNFRFNLDEEQVFQRLFGRRLYGRIDAALRELIQNAIDATRVRVAIECSRGAGWKDLSIEKRQSAFHDAIAVRSSELAIQVQHEVRHDAGTGRTQEWLHVVDCGVGMSRDVIQRFLLKVGRSRWREDPDVRALGIGMVGEFGIGFLSCFMVSERTIIETHSCLPDEVGVRATIFNWKGYLATEVCKRPSPGTRVSLLLKPELAVHLKPIFDLVSYWCPFPEFPIKVTECTTITRLHNVVPLGSNAETNTFCFGIGDHGTIAEVSTRRRKQDKAVTPSLCQDGLAIPDVPPPILERPDQQILRQLSLRVNLRGTDRLPLDLSRNIVEGGADELWNQLIPRVWGGLVRYAMILDEFREALGDYLQQVFENSLGQAVFRVSKDMGFAVTTVADFASRSSLEFLDPQDDRFHRLAQLCDDVIILPSQPLSLLYGNTIVSEDDENDFGERKSDPVTTFWARKGGNPNSWHDDEELSKTDTASLSVLQAYLPLIFERYTYIDQSATGAAKLLARRFSGACSIKSLGLFRISREWIAIRSPRDGTWQCIHADDAEASYAELPLETFKALKFEEYVLLLLYDTWPQTLDWEAGWPSNKRLGKEILAAQVESEKAKDLENPYVEDGENEEDDDDDDELDEEDDDAIYDYYDDNDTEPQLRDIEEEREEMFQLELPERRRVERHGAKSIDHFTSLAADFLKEIVPRIDSRKLQKNLTSWDREAWEDSKKTAMGKFKRRRGR